MRPGALVIGHRGAPGYRAEHTRSSFQLAIAQGADAIEVDVVLTADRVPIVRHDRELGATTDIGGRAVFAGLRRSGDADGADVVGWFAEDLTWAQVRTLSAVPRGPAAGEPAVAEPPVGEAGTPEPVLRLGEVAALAAEAGVLLVVELKEATRHAALGLPLVEAVLAELAAVDPLPGIVVESFEKAPLTALAAAGVPWRLVYLLDDTGRAPDEALVDGPDYAAELADPHRLGAFTGVSLPTALVTGEEVRRLHAAGLDVWTWTLRPENRFLPQPYRRGPDADALGDWTGAWRALLETGVDALFADHPDLAVRVRDEAAARDAPSRRGERQPASRSRVTSGVPKATARATGHSSSSSTTAPDARSADPSSR